jgi:hypothetical protein
MPRNKQLRPSVGADYRAHRRFIGPNTHQPKMPHSVTLSRSEGCMDYPHRHPAWASTS